MPSRPESIGLSSASSQELVCACRQPQHIVVLGIIPDTRLAAEDIRRVTDALRPDVIVDEHNTQKYAYWKDKLPESLRWDPNLNDWVFAWPPYVTTKQVKVQKNRNAHAHSASRSDRGGNDADTEAKIDESACAQRLHAPASCTRH